MDNILSSVETQSRKDFSVPGISKESMTNASMMMCALPFTSCLQRVRESAQRSDFGACEPNLCWTISEDAQFLRRQRCGRQICPT